VPILVAACGASGSVTDVTATGGQDIYRYSPDSITAVQGGSIGFKNTTDQGHNLTVDGQSFVIELPVGGTVSKAVDLPPGSYTFQCTVIEGAYTMGHYGMKGTLTVTAKP